MRSRLAEMKGALTWSQKILSQLPQTDLTIEAWINSIIPHCLIVNELGFAEESIEMASQALYMAEQLNAPITIAHARTNLIDCTANAGRIVDTINLVHSDQQETYRFASNYTETELASSLYRLGNYNEAELVMKNIISTYTGGRRERALGFSQRLEALWGVGGLEGVIYPTANGSLPSEWITEALRSLMLAYGTPREGKDHEKRAAYFQQAIENCRKAVGIEGPWAELFSQWVVVTAHLGRGEFADAAGIIEHAEKPSPEWLDIRVLILGAALELSLSWQAPEYFSTAKYEHKLRQVFTESAQISYASPAGLGRLLHRWHPTAAAYLALAPEPVLACAFASKSVMKVGAINTIEDLILPPVMAADLMLRALDFDLQRDFAFVQSDAGASRIKRKMLIQMYGAVPVWLLPVSAIKIAYGLMQYQHSNFHERARTVITTYGLCPSTTALPPMVNLLDGVAYNTNKLLSGHLTPKGFAAEMAALRP